MSLLNEINSALKLTESQSEENPFKLDEFDKVKLANPELFENSCGEGKCGEGKCGCDEEEEVLQLDAGQVEGFIEAVKDKLNASNTEYTPDNIADVAHDMVDNIPGLEDQDSDERERVVKIAITTLLNDK